MKNIISLAVFFVFLLSSCEDSNSPETNVITLENAYRQNSESMLKQFLDKWHDEYPAYDIGSSVVDTVTGQAVYQVIEAFYNYELLKAIADNSEFSRYWDDVPAFVVIPNIIMEYRYNSDSIAHTGINYYYENEYRDFRPNVIITNCKTLFLTPKYDTIVNSYLGSDDYQANFGDDMSEEEFYKEQSKRVKFINKYLYVYHGHWGNYFHIESSPIPSSVRFYGAFKYATVNFRMGFQGGYADFRKEDGKWILLGWEMTWIE